MNNLTIKDLPVSERPYEKVENYGAEFLSDAELLAVILRSGTKSKKSIDLAHDILRLNDNNEGLLILNNATLEELCQIDGVGRVKAIQLLCVAELSKRMSQRTRSNGIYFNSADDVANHYMQRMRHLETEEVILLLLNSKYKLLKEIKLSKGTVNASLASPREVFIYALRHQAVQIVLLHNHPSGNPVPSKDDINLTLRMAQSGKLLGVKVVDHIIIGDNVYVSMAKEKIID